MTGVEVDFCVHDVHKAFELYEKVFGAEAVEKTAFERGLNECLFTIFGFRFHMLDENPEYGLSAPKEGESASIWFNILVEAIQPVYDKALELGFTVIQPLQNMPDYGVQNAMVKDPFGIVWMLHQIDKIVSFEDRVKLAEDAMNQPVQ
jgi:PhnB protein